MCSLISQTKYYPKYFSSFFAFLQKPPQTPWARRRRKGNVLQTPNLHGNPQLIGRLLGYLLGNGFLSVSGHADVSLQWFRTLVAWFFTVEWLFTVHWFRGVPRELFQKVDFFLVVFLISPYRIVFGDFFLGDFVVLGVFPACNGRILWPEKLFYFNFNIYIYI